MIGRSALCVVVALCLLGCSDRALSTTSDRSGFVQRQTTSPGAGVELQSEIAAESGVAAATASAPSTSAPRSASSSTPDPVETRTVTGTVVSALDGAPLAGATVMVGADSAVSGADGSFTLAGVDDRQPLVVTRPVWQERRIDLAPLTGAVLVELDPVVVRALRVSRYVAPDAVAFEELLSLADETSVNALVFDTKDEEDTVLYETQVAFPNQIGAVDAVYDPGDLLARAKDRGLYTITRIVTFEDSQWAGADAEAKLAGAWVDAADEANWAYPLDLAVEACGIGFDEIQFDYVRFPAGRTAVAASGLLPPTSEERSAVIAGFLAEARSRLHPLGCGVSAAVFGIVMSSATDEGIGQTPETVSAVVDAVSPMLYPSHFSAGWLGFADPNEHPGPVIAHGLDTGAVRMAAPSLMRPWIQGFYYDGSQVLSQIHEAEARGAGWIIWNASGTYSRSWLPPPS